MTTQQRGPFDRLLRTTDDTPPEPERQDRAAIYIAGTIIGLAILLLVLLLPPVSILSRGGDGDSAISTGPGTSDKATSTVRSGMPKLPAGLVAASALYDLSAPTDQQGASRLTIPLKEKQTEPRSLALYSYVDGKWQRVSDITLVAGGEAARGEVGALPGNVAVLRRSQATMQVAGSIPAGATLDERAGSVITTLHPIVFIAAGDGTIIGQPPAVPPAAYKVVPAIVTLAPDTVDNILRSSELQSRHATAIADAVEQGNFEGIMVDYRGVNPALREQYTAFVGLLARALHDKSRKLTLTLPLPQQKDGQIDTGAYDWEALGKLTDTIELAGELDQELYFQNTEAAIDYVTGKVDRTKILLSISSLSVERGGDGLRAMPHDDALALASVVGVNAEGDIAPNAKVQLVAQNLAETEGASGLHWDDTARSVTFNYPGRGGKRTVWIANSFSAAFRLDLAQRHGLGGVTINDVSVEGGGADVWTPVLQASDTGSLTLTRPNGELLMPAWSTTDGNVAPQSGTAVTWTAPAAPGSYSLTLIVSDGVVRTGQLVNIEVAPPVIP